MTSQSQVTKVGCSFNPLPESFANKRVCDMPGFLPKESLSFVSSFPTAEDSPRIARARTVFPFPSFSRSYAIKRSKCPTPALCTRVSSSHILRNTEIHSCHRPGYADPPLQPTLVCEPASNSFRAAFFFFYMTTPFETMVFLNNEAYPPSQK